MGRLVYDCFGSWEMQWGSPRVLEETPLKILTRVIAILLISGGFLVGARQLRAEPAQCDRACLIATVDTYLGALVAHDPSRVNLSPDVKFVENTVPMKPGDGLWKTASALPTTFKIYMPDPVSEEVGFMGVMKESDKPVELGLRLKIQNGKITQAEHLIARNL